jgi:hypothetical protein
MIKEYYKHLWKYVNKIHNFIQLIDTNKKKEKENSKGDIIQDYYSREGD